MEKISSHAKDSRIKTLEDLVIRLGYDPANVKAAEELIKNKNVDIVTLRKQLKLPATEDPLAKEIIETENHKADMMKLVIEKNSQIRQMEIQVERLIEEAKKSVVPL